MVCLAKSSVHYAEAGAMGLAVAGRCSCLPSLPDSGHLFGWRPSLPGKPHVRAEAISRTLVGERVVVAFLKTSMLSQLKPVLKSMYYLIPPQLDAFRLSKRKEICVIDQELQNYESLAVKHLFTYQMMFSTKFRDAFLLAIAVLLGLPSEALAEACEGDTMSIFNMPLLFAIAMIGATVGGLLARQRKEELKHLNDQLRQINAALRRQAKIESYAPNLSYAPVGRIPETEVIVESRKQQLIANLKLGKNFLRNQEPDKAYHEFKVALDLAKAIGDPVEEKKAARGLGASLQRQGKYKDAIKYHSMVLKISDQVGEDSGNTEAYGAIADCCTELGDLEQAGTFYDMYIARLETD